MYRDIEKRRKAVSEAVKRYRQKNKQPEKILQDITVIPNKDITDITVIPTNDLKLYQNDDFKELYNKVEKLESALNRLIEVLKHNGMRGF